MPHGEEKRVEFWDNHELHGALLGIGTAALIKIVRPQTGIATLAPTAGFVGYVSAAAMKTFGHFGAENKIILD